MSEQSPFPVESGLLCVDAVCRKAGTAGTLRRRRAVPGLRLCPVCRDELAAGLRELPYLHAECEKVLGGRLSTQHRERTSGGPLPGMPFNVAAADVRSAIVGVLGSWSGLVAEGRGVTGPPRTPHDLGEFLGRHVDWLAGHPAAADLTAEIRKLVRSARRLAHPEPRRRLRIGTCVHPGCGGELSAVIKDLAPEQPSEITCTADPRHTWPGHSWTRLRGQIQRGAPTAERWLTAGQISQLWRTPTGTVYRLASQQRWRRRSQAGRTYYHEGDVQHCFEQRLERSGPCPSASGHAESG